MTGSSRGIACGEDYVSRRELIGAVAASLFAGSGGRAAIRSPSIALPAEVAGIRIPGSAIARKAASFSREHCPAFLFNHCMRTFVFGAIHAERHQIRYDQEAAFVAAALHDVGLLPAFASAGNTFEVDGANAAENFLHGQNASQAETNRTWNAIALHALRRQYIARQSGEVLVLSAGVGTDFGGPDPHEIEAQRTSEIVAAFPRLQFKTRFLGLLTDHCHRKPLSQDGTWLGDWCQAQVSGIRRSSIKDSLMAAPFSE
jgi:hypothetical protein